MKMYKYVILETKSVMYIDDKIFADFMNKSLTIWQRIRYWIWS